MFRKLNQLGVVIVTTATTFVLLSVPAEAKPKVPPLSPDGNYPGHDKVNHLANGVLGVTVVVLGVFAFLGLATAAASIRGKKQGGIAAGFGTFVACAIVIGIAFSFSSFLQSWVNWI